MAKKSGPRARPITVSELIARSETDGAFPKASDDEAPTRRRTVGASGMPSHAPAKPEPDEPAVGPEANAVTGIIPIVRDDDFDSAVDTDGFTPLEVDDPVGFDLPPVEYRTAPIAPVVASVAAVEPDPDVTTPAQLKAIVDGDETLDGDDDLDADNLDYADPDDADLDYSDLDYDADLDDAEADLDDNSVDEDAVEILAAQKPNKRALRDRARKVKAAKSKAGKKQAGAEKAAAEKAADEPSAVMAWLALVAEIVVGLAIGAGLFWGFTELWKRYVYLALILAVVVIFAIVTFAHILRKRDLPTTLLALGVGMLVTIGPLVLLAA